MQTFGGRRFGRRNSRGAGASAPVVWTPAQIASHWYRGEPSEVMLASGDVAAMIDIVDDDDAVQATTRPAYDVAIATLGDRPGAVFTKADSDHLQSSAFATTLTQPFSVAVAWSHSELVAATSYAFVGGGGGGGGRWFIRANGTTLQMFAGTGAAQASITLETDTAYVGIFVFNGTSSKMWVNGSDVYAGSTNVGTNAAGLVILGREESLTYFAGSLGECSLYSGDLLAHVDAAKAKVYLTGRYL